MNKQFPRILFGLLAGLVLCTESARSAGWVAMDWIDGWYETSTPAMRQELGVTRATINCKNLSIRTTPKACIDWIRANPTTGITQYVPYINVGLSRVENDAKLYSQYSVGSPVSEVDIDDFFTTFGDWYDVKGSGTAAFLGRVIDNFKSVNPNLKFGITLYENELDSRINPYISTTVLPASIKAKVNVVRLFLHFRANGPNYATYVTQAKAMFPNAKIIAGVYGYDRIDYLSCTQADRSTPCTQSQELNYFQQALTIQLQLLKEGKVAELDFYPGYFGAETQLFGPGEDSVNLECRTISRCVQNTVKMRDMIRSAHNSFQNPPPPPTGTAPVITRQPTNTLLQVGQTQIFSLTATGSTPLTYQWRKNGVSISGATLASYHTPPVTASDHNAAYSCIVKNAYGQVTSAAGVVTIISAGTAPVITRQPTNTLLQVGQTQIFSVTATGTAPMTYQWRRNGVSISGATSASYHTPQVTSSDHNSAYSCVVKNAYGQVTSAAGVVTIISAGTAPVITRQPTNTDLLLGQTQIFSVTATGTAPLTYQWRRNGVGISGATQSSYHTPPVTSADQNAAFTCVVRNSYGQVTSNPGVIRLLAGAPGVSVEAIAEPAAGVVYPNPWRGDRHGAQLITFKDLTAGSIINIFTVSAHAVRTLFSSGASVTWDRKNDSGDRVASGLYIYLITNSRGQQIRGKLAVIN